MREGLLLFLVCALTHMAKARDLPRDGNGLLDSCNALVEAANNQATLMAVTGDKFAERLAQVDWCAGYLSAVQDVLVTIHVNLMLMPATNVKLDGPEKAKAYWVDHLNVACMPDDKIPIVQMGALWLSGCAHIQKDCTS
jgi:hypothetical protein